MRDDARRRGGEAIVASLLSLLEEYSCNGHAGVALLRQFFFDPAQPAAGQSLSDAAIRERLEDLERGGHKRTYRVRQY